MEAQTLEQIAALSFRFSSERAASAADAVESFFTKVAPGSVRLRNSVHCPSAYGKLAFSLVEKYFKSRNYLFVAHHLFDIF